MKAQHLIKRYNAIIILLIVFQLLFSCNQNTNTSKPHLSWVHVYQSIAKDNFSFQNLVYNLQVSQLPDSLQPKYDVLFCASNFKIPYYFCTQYQMKNIRDTTIVFESDSAKDYRTRTTTTMHYNHDGMIETYVVNGQKDVYQANYIYDPKCNITIISEHNNKIECTYDANNNITNVLLMDGNMKPLEKLRIEYLYN